MGLSKEIEAGLRRARERLTEIESDPRGQDAASALHEEIDRLEQLHEAVKAFKRARREARRGRFLSVLR